MIRRSARILARSSAMRTAPTPEAENRFAAASSSSAALAAVVGKAPSWVSRLERGAAPLEFSQLEAIAKVLGCSAADLLPPSASSPAPPRWKNRDFVVLSSVHLSKDSAREVVGGAIRERLAAGAQIYPVVSARDAEGRWCSRRSGRQISRPAPTLLSSSPPS
ncbi:helix-turn-helix transcriptional regulator [Streptomyces roseus]|uniref:helix-turn-helix domain-containing protein n=1 Tax=Streptomyces roseus TaxID=66430 RepID=UPI0033C61E38